MEKRNVIRIDYSDSDCSYIGTAEELSKEIKAWIVEDIYRIPEENERPFIEDPEFLLELRLANKLDELALKDRDNTWFYEEETPLYDIVFVNYFNEFSLHKLERKEKIAE